MHDLMHDAIITIIKKIYLIGFMVFHKIKIQEKKEKKKQKKVSSSLSCRPHSLSPSPSTKLH